MKWAGPWKLEDGRWRRPYWQGFPMTQTVNGSTTHPITQRVRFVGWITMKLWQDGPRVH